MATVSEIWPPVTTTVIVFGLRCPVMGQGKKVGPARSHLLETEVDGEISLYDPQTEQVTVLNSTASDVWTLADGESTLEEIVATLAKAYGLAEDRIASDVRDTVEQFTEQGLFETS